MASPSFIFGGNKPSANPTSNGFIFGTPSPNPAEDPIETWTRGNFKATYCNGGGKHTVPIDVEFFKQSLEKRRPEAVVEIGEAIKRLDVEITENICKEFAIDENGTFTDYAGVINKLYQIRPDLAKGMMVSQVVDQMETYYKNDLERVGHSTHKPHTPMAPEQPLFARALTTSQTKTPSNDTGNDKVSGASTFTTSYEPNNIPTAKSVEKDLRTFLEQYHDAADKSKAVATPLKLSEQLQKPSTGQSEIVAEAPKSHDDTLADKLLTQEDAADLRARAQLECDKLTWTATTRDLNRGVVVTAVAKQRPDIPRKRVEAIVRNTTASYDDILANKPLKQEDSANLLARAQLECDKLTWTATTRDLNRGVVVTAVAKQRPDIPRKRVEAIVRNAEELHQNPTRQAAMAAKTAPKPAPAAPAPRVASKFLEGPQDEWVYQQYVEHAFDLNGFKGYKWLKAHIMKQRPQVNQTLLLQVMNRLRCAGPESKYYFGDVSKMALKRKAEIKKAAPQKSNTSNATDFQSLFPGSFPGPSLVAQSALHDTIAPAGFMPPPVPDDQAPKNDLLARKLNQLNQSNKAEASLDGSISISMCTETAEGSDSESGVIVSASSRVRKAAQSNNSPANIDHSDMMALLSDSDDDEHEDGEVNDEFDTEIQHAPLLDEDFLSEDSMHLVPQYGLVGTHNESSNGRSKLFLNTNTPFSAFICGVQGSGKSHTTSCIMENSLIPSKNLGKLQSPLSALVFSYGPFSGDGSGYNISEAAFLAAAHPKMPGGAHVKKVNVFVSPSNYVRISKLYLRLPNVTVTPFKLKPWNLDIDIMLTLMNVSESGEAPLYMAQVTQILRTMASAGGPFNYMAFKATLKQQRFNPVQVNMLQMRLNLLESFLDLNNTCAEPQFKPGEVTIMDMSCPFVDPNTACILFRIGLQRYLQSDSSGKMIVLDEAHKYMLNIPGAKALNETLLQTIRLQRHYGARVIISTQEPTLLTDLIALCSITIVHRFSSPEWLAAIKRHIPMSPETAQGLMSRVESLKTGTGLVYSSNAVLGWGRDDKLIKGIGKMMKLSIRKRITSDGGQSVLAV